MGDSYPIRAVSSHGPVLFVLLFFQVIEWRRIDDICSRYFSTSYIRIIYFAFTISLTDGFMHCNPFGYRARRYMVILRQRVLRDIPNSDEALIRLPLC